MRVWFSSVMLLGMFFFEPLPVAGAPLSCSDLVLTKPQKHTWDLFRKSPIFEYDVFQSFKARFREQKEENYLIDPWELDSVEARLALFEVISEQNDQDLFKIGDILTNGTRDQQRRLKKIIEKLDFQDEGIRESRLRNVVLDLYWLSNSPPALWSQIKEFRSRNPIKDLIQQRVEIAFLQTDFFEAFKELGLIRKPNHLEKLKTWLSDHPNVSNILSETFSQALLWKLTSYVFPLPHIEILQPTNWVKEEKRQPLPLKLNALIGKAQTVFKTRATIDIGQRIARTTLATVCLVVVGHMIYEIAPMARFAYGLSQTDWTKAESTLQEDFDLKQAQIDDFKSWYDGFQAMKERSPTQEEAKEEWAYISQKTKEDFAANPNSTL